MEYKYKFSLSCDILPKGFKYPDVYIQFVSMPLPELPPWIFFVEQHLVFDRLESHFKSLQKRYPAREVVPFARRFDNNDVACFDASGSSNHPKVVVIDCMVPPGSEDREEYDNFMEWLEVAKKTTKEWQAL